MALAEKRNIEIIGLNWRDERPDAISMINQLGNPFSQIAFDPNSEAVIDWGVYGAPESFLLDADGRIIYKRVGEINPRIWRSEIAPLLDRLEVQSSYDASD